MDYEDIIETRAVEGLNGSLPIRDTNISKSSI